MRRTLLATPLVGLGLRALPAGAATRPQVTDPIGDANGLNSQSIGLPVPSQATSPASVKGSDITSLALVTGYRKVGSRKVPRSVSLVLTLADTPAAGG